MAMPLIERSIPIWKRSGGCWRGWRRGLNPAIIPEGKRGFAIIMQPYRNFPMFVGVQE